MLVALRWGLGARGLACALLSSILNEYAQKNAINLLYMWLVLVALTTHFQRETRETQQGACAQMHFCSH